MTLSSTAITTVAKVKDHLWLNDFDARLQQPGISIHHDGQDQVSMTVEVRGDDLILTGDVSGTDTIDLTGASNDTLSELATTLNALMGSGEGALYATVLSHGDQDAVNLLDTESASCFGVANRQVLYCNADRRLELLIERATSEIERYLDRGIVSRSYTQLYYFDRDERVDTIYLREPNISQVTRFAVEANSILHVSYTGSDTHATVEVTSSAVVLQDTTTGTSTLAFTDNSTATAMATAIAAVSGWTASVPSGVDTAEPTSRLIQEGARNAEAVTVELNAWEDYDDGYVVDYGVGSITPDWPSLNIGWLNGWPYTARRRVQVVYTAGFATVPNAIEEVALELIARNWMRQGPESRREARADFGLEEDEKLLDRLYTYRRVGV